MDAREKQQQERRRRMRFPIRRELRYKLMEGNVVVGHGMGETINISSGGIWFTAGSELPRGVLIELSIGWPVLLGENTRLRLVLLGRVVRSSGDFAACTVDKYEFRTQARSAAAAAGAGDAPKSPVGQSIVNFVAAAAGAGA
jgi:hypothetical protein